MPRVHSNEQTAQDLAALAEDAAQSIAVALREGQALPHGPTLNTPESLAVYRALFSDQAKAVKIAAIYGRLGTGEIIKTLGGGGREGGAAFLASVPGLEPLLRETWRQLKGGA